MPALGDLPLAPVVPLVIDHVVAVELLGRVARYIESKRSRVFVLVHTNGR
jgi:hypothetical protein